MDDKTKILVVDDEEVVRLSYLRSLAGSRCKVEEAWDGKEAVRLGAHDYLAKPVGPDDVINAANDAVMHKRWGLHSIA